MEKTYFMHLHEEPFQLILQKRKTVEMRLNKGERQNIKSGDLIIFSHSLNEDKIKVKVLKVSRFNSFEELYENYDQTLLGYKENEIASYKDMNTYYNDEDIETFGVLAIEIEFMELLVNYL